MVIDVHVPRAVAPERLPAVVGHEERRAEHVDAAVVLRVDPDLAEIERSRLERAHLLPRLSAIVGPENPAVLVLVRQVDDVRVLPVDVDADAADVAGGQAALDARPRSRGVGRLVQPAARSAAVETVRLALPLVGRRVERVRIARIHGDVDEPRVLVDELRVGPRLPAVGRLEQPALPVRAEQVAGRRDIDDVGVCRVNDDAADVLRVGEPHEGPRRAAVGRFVDAVAPRRALAVVRLAGADPDDVRVGARDGDVADRRRAEVVEDRRPRRSAVHRLPHAAGGRADVDRVGMAFVDRDVVDAPAGDGGTDRAPLEIRGEWGSGEREREKEGEEHGADSSGKGRKAERQKGRKAGERVAETAIDVPGGRVADCVLP